MPNNGQANTIGLALYDNPVGQLAWIGEKFVNCEPFIYPLNPPG
jgi:hypothetical protein